MIPTDEECGETFNTTDKRCNIYQHHSNTMCVDHSCFATCAEQTGYQLADKFQIPSSRTDKPRLAHEVYWQWINYPMAYNQTQISASKMNELLIAAYSGAKLMYRK